MRAAVYDRLGSAELARAAGADAVVDYRAEDAASAVRAAAPDGVDRLVEVACGEDGSALIAESVLGGLCHATVGTPAPRKTSRTSGFRVMLIAAHLARRSQRVDLATARRTWWSPPEALA